MRRLFIGMLAMAFLSPAQATEFSISWYSSNSGGTLEAGAGPWDLKGSIGQANAAIVPAQGGPWRVQSGFWAGFQAQQVPGLQIDPVFLNFGQQALGQASNARTVTLSNTGEVSLSLDAITLESGDVADFALDATSCGGSLGVGESCTVQVVFTPGSQGPRAAVMQIDSNAPGSPFDVLLNGIGTVDSPADDVIFRDRFQFLPNPQIGQM